MTSPNPDTWMPFYMGDFEASTTSLSYDEKWAYIKIIFEYWRLGHKGIKLKFDKKSMKFCTKISSKKVEKILSFFENRNGYLFHARIEKEIKKTKGNHLVNQRRAKKAANARWGKKDAPSIPQAVLGDILEECPLPLHTLLKDKESFRESKAHTDFKNLIFEKKFVEIAKEANLEGEIAEKCWKKFKLHFEAAPPGDWLKSWGKWVLNERIRPPHTAAAENLLQGAELVAQRLGISNWKRQQKMFLSSEEIKFLYDWEAKNNMVWWINIEEWRKGQ